MSNIFEIFDPGLRHWKRQQELEKTLIVPGALGGKGPVQVDLDKGTIVVRRQASTIPTEDEDAVEDPTTEPGDEDSAAEDGAPRRAATDPDDLDEGAADPDDEPTPAPRRGQPVDDEPAPRPRRAAPDED